MEEAVKTKDGGLSRGGGSSNARVSKKEGAVVSVASRKGAGRVRDLRPAGVKKQRRLILSDSESDEDLGGSGCFQIGGNDRNFIDRKTGASPIKGDEESAVFEGRGPRVEDCKEEYIDRNIRTGDGDGDFIHNSIDGEKIRGAYSEDKDPGSGHKESFFDKKTGSKDAEMDCGSIDERRIPVSALVVLDDNTADGKRNEVSLSSIQEQTKAEVLQASSENVVGSYSTKGESVVGKREREQGNGLLEAELQHNIKRSLPSNDNEFNSNRNGVKVQFNSHRRAAAILVEKKIKISSEISLQVKSDGIGMKPHEEENDLGASTASNGCKELKQRIKSNGSVDSASSIDHSAPLYETLASRKARLCAISMGVECGKFGSSSVNSTTLKRKDGGLGMGLSAYNTQKTKRMEKDFCLKSSSKSRNDIGSVEGTKSISKEDKGIMSWTSDSDSMSYSVVNKEKESGKLPKFGKTEKMQLVREKVKNMLLSAGWKIEQRPRRDSDYEDTVYVCPSGSVYWSIPNAYYALKKQLDSALKVDSLCMAAMSGDEKLLERHPEHLCGEEDNASCLEDTIDSSSAHKVDSIQNLRVVQSLFYSFSKAELDVLTRKRKMPTDGYQKKGKVSVQNVKKLRKNADGIQSITNLAVDKVQKVVKGLPVVHCTEKKQPKRGKGAGASGKKTNSCDVKLLSSIGRKGITGKTGVSAIKFNGVDGRSSNNPKVAAELVHDHESHAFVSSSHKRSLKHQSFLPAVSENMPGRKKKGKRKCILMVRSSSKEENSSSDSDRIPCLGKPTILAWLIDSGILQLSGKARYLNKKHTRVMMEGHISRDGILCNCCGKTLSVAKFEIHAGSKLCQPYQNIFVESGMSLLECQLQAWNAQEESERCGMYVVQTDESDQNDDTCGICGDGGNLICCDSCPSTFHLSCLALQTLPPGLWHCPHCSCRFCGRSGDSSKGGCAAMKPMQTCSQCEAKYHHYCREENDTSAVGLDSQSSSFCGSGCRKLFEQLKDILGAKHDLDGGFSWTIVQRDGVPQCKLAERAECNSKIAVALSLMDECFMPIVDRRTNANLIHNIVYNRGSNFNRVNYSGFYTLLLEKGDEVISVASIRIHGTRLAEMPLIGTRHIYRRQGMCRRLFTALESVLSCLNVEMLIIPAISELLDTWTVVFGFKPLKESHRKELRRMNLMVFPGTDLLQKAIPRHASIEENSEGKRDDFQHDEDYPVEDTIFFSVNGSHFCEDPTAKVNVDAFVKDFALSVSEVIMERAEVAAKSSLLLSEEIVLGRTDGEVDLKLTDPQCCKDSSVNVDLCNQNEDIVYGSCLVKGKDAASEHSSNPSTKGSASCVPDVITRLSEGSLISSDLGDCNVTLQCTSEDNSMKLNVAKSAVGAPIEDASSSVEDAKCSSFLVLGEHAMPVPNVDTSQGNFALEDTQPCEVAVRSDFPASDNAVFDCPVEKMHNSQEKHPACFSQS